MGRAAGKMDSKTFGGRLGQTSVVNDGFLRKAAQIMEGINQADSFFLNQLD